MRRMGERGFGWVGFVTLAFVSVGCKSGKSAPTADEAPLAPQSASGPLQTPAVLPAGIAPPLPSPLPGERQDVTDLAASALHAVIADLDGDGQAELVFVDANRIWIAHPSGRIVAEAPVPAAIQVLRAVDLDGDGRFEIVAGWGRSHAHQGGTTRITIHRLQGNALAQELITAPATTRQDVASFVASENGTLTVAFFESKYIVKVARARHAANQWTLEDLATLRMATTLAWGDVDGDGSSDLVVGRVYGEEQGSDGDAFVLRPGGQRVPIPTVRGVRGLTVADVDGDGRDEVYLGDGWHQDYGKQARGLLSRARWKNGAFETEVLHNTPGQYTLWDILPADVDGDGRKELITRGSSYVRAFRLHQGRWQGLTMAGASRGIAVGQLDGVPGDEVLVLGNRSTVVNLRNAEWIE